LPYFTDAGHHGFATVEAVIQSEFPNAEISRVDPESAIACGATLDCAQVTDRLPPAMHEIVKGVVPYTIGMCLMEEVITFLIQRGETLPAVGETSLSTIIDNQDEMSLAIYQGEHRLCEQSDLIGETQFTDLPRLPRGQCAIDCRIEYDESGLLQFSAREKGTKKSITTTFQAQTKFTQDDHLRLVQASRMCQTDEEQCANVRSERT
jgi:molecular chaperone DnaK (HSP70)